MPLPTTPLSRRLLIIPTVVLLTVTLSIVLHLPHYFNPFNNPLLHLSTTPPSFLHLDINQAARAPAPSPVPSTPCLSSPSQPDPATALFLASSINDTLTQCTVLGNLIYSDAQQRDFAATLLALPHNSFLETSILNPSRPLSGIVRCLVRVTEASFPPLETLDLIPIAKESPLPSDIGVNEDSEGTDLVSGHGVPIIEDDEKEICFGGCDIRVYQIVRVVGDSGNGVDTGVTMRNTDEDSNRRWWWQRFNRVSGRNDINNNERKRGLKRRNQKQNEAKEKLTPTSPETETWTGIETDDETETLTFIVVQPSFTSPCPPRPRRSPLQHPDAHYCFEEQDLSSPDDVGPNTPSFTLIAQTPPPMSVFPVIRQSGPVPVNEKERKEMDELCVRYNWLLWKSTGQVDYAVGYRIRTLSNYPVPPSPPFIRQASTPLPLSLPLHCSTIGINAASYDPRHCAFDHCDTTTYNITSLLPPRLSTIVQFSYRSECSFIVDPIRECDVRIKFGATPNSYRYPIAASFTVTDPKNDREKSVRTAVQRLRQQGSFSKSAIQSNLVVETKRIDDRTYRVIFRFREQFGSEL